MYIKNRLPHTVLKGKSPIEIATGRRPTAEQAAIRHFFQQVWATVYQGGIQRTVPA